MRLLSWSTKAAADSWVTRGREEGIETYWVPETGLIKGGLPTKAVKALESSQATQRILRNQWRGEGGGEWDDAVAGEG